jgi:hypothetical protein
MPAPYVPINTLCYVLVFVGFRRICARFDVGNMSAVLLFIATTALDRRIINLWVEPWTTTLSAAFVWLAFAEAARMMFGDAKQRPALLGALLMGIALVRPADVVISALIGLFALWRPVIVERRFAALLAVAASALAPTRCLCRALSRHLWPAPHRLYDPVARLRLQLRRSGLEGEHPAGRSLGLVPRRDRLPARDPLDADRRRWAGARRYPAARCAARAGSCACCCRAWPIAC